MTVGETGTDRIRIVDYDYDLPQELIAQVPLEDRSASRLLVLDRHSGATVHTSFRRLPEYLRRGDLLVFNDSRVIPARLRIQRESGGRGELLLLRRDDDGVWTALGRPARKLHAGERVAVSRADGETGEPGGAEICGRDAAGLVHVRLDAGVEHDLDAFGEVPLPPYITAELKDRERYQTVYSHERGSAAAPTAGLHFTNEILETLRDMGVATAFVTLHVGLDTFRPVTAEYAEEHEIHSEWCSVPQETVDAIDACQARGGRVIAVGTTSARTLETLGQQMRAGHTGPFSGPTNIYITPGYEWTLVDGLFTNFHLPKSTLMLMVSALAGRDRIMRAYAEAIAERYRFYSFGDAMLIISQIAQRRQQATMGYPDTQGKTREDGLALLDEWITSDSLKRHCLSVEAAMRAYAEKYGEDVDAWGLVGLVHDFDYEKHPTLDQHPVEGAPVLREHGYPEWLVEAVLSHGEDADVPRDTPLRKTLYAVDELCGFVSAVALVRPSKSVRDVKVSSVKKKLKDRKFAEAVDREQMRESAGALGVEFDDHIALVIEALSRNAEELGLAGV